MEPALDERGDPPATLGRPTIWRPQWSPLSTSGATQDQVRNQVQEQVWPQWSPLSTSGATAAVQPQQPIGLRPQWSPLSTSGATWLGMLRAWIRAPPQWSPLSTSGATRQPCRCGSRRSSRNGARSRRAGRPARTLPRGRPAHAAMEPALDERGDHPRRPERLLRRAGAAMEPALDERGDRQTSSESVSTYRPQWSPLSTSGATWTYIRQAS